MSAALQPLIAGLDNILTPRVKPKSVDGEHVTQLDSFSMWLRLEYHIDTYGERKTKVDDGTCHEVTILKAYLSNEHKSFEQEISLRLLGHDIVDLETEIGLKLDEEQSNE